MLQGMKVNVCALALALCAAHSAMAADSVDVKVIGTITPAGCTPTISGGGTVDYGTIKASSLSPTDYTVLDTKSVDFAIVCDAPTKVSFSAVNGRPGSLAGAPEVGVVLTGRVPSGVVLLNQTTMGAAGLGLSGSAKVGGYGLGFKNPDIMVDGVNRQAFVSNDNATWRGDATDYSAITFFSTIGSNRYFTVADIGGSVPVAFKNFSSKLYVQAYLNKASELDLTKPVQLDGLATIEMLYL